MKTLKTLAAGGPGGEVFDEYWVPAGRSISAVQLHAEPFVHGLQLVWSGRDGLPMPLPRIGGEEGREHLFVLEPGEVLLGVSGRHGWYLDSLQFHTDRRVSERFGGPGGEETFGMFAPEGMEVVGFHGRAGRYLDALGLICRHRR